MNKLIIAHRGASRYAHENTIAAFKKAIDIGADMIELDIRKTKDNVFIAHHDRFAFGKPLHTYTFREIRDRMREKEIEISTLEEILEATNKKIRLDVELKETGYENPIIESLLKYFDGDEFIISSSNQRQLNKIKNINPDIRTGFILGMTLNKENIHLIRSGEIFNELNLDYLIIQWELFKLAFKEERPHRPVFLWTVNHESLLHEFIGDNRVEGIITDVPDLALAIRDGAGRGG